MILDKFKEESYYFSGETSKLVNQYALAGIAVIWIFKTDKQGQPLIPQDLLLPLILFVCSLLFALLQYFISSLVWELFFIRHEKVNNGNTNVNIKAPIWCSLPGRVLYFLKVIALILGFVFTAFFLVKKINVPTANVASEKTATGN